MGACVGRADVMDRAWPESDGEAIHTSTFLGHPVGCAMALAQMAELESRGLVERAASEGAWLRGKLEVLAKSEDRLQLRAVGRGLMAGLEVRSRDGVGAGHIVVQTMQRLLRDGILILPEGADAEVLSLTPPLTIGRREFARALGVIVSRLGEVSS
jgi:4-aminobutyrate aminotransferase-like enzyme